VQPPNQPFGRNGTHPMKKRTLFAGVVALSLAAVFAVRGATLPKAVESAPCRTAPTIDGVIGDDEWRDARVYKFDMPVIRLNPSASETRPCELRAMNSANALYLALRVPDQTADDSLSPLVLDLAMLAFCQGDEVRAGDDRKAIAHGLYRDKAVDAPGKGDKDDPKQDGRGVMGRAKGFCSFEWAVPLGATDKDDLRAKPGDAVRFNVTYFDAFQLPLTKTQVGGAYGAQLDRADAWGTLRLASDVKDDGGSAFEGPAWVRPLLREAASGPATRLRVTETAPAAGSNTAKALVTFTYRDEHGAEKEAKAKLYLPERVKAGGDVKVPLVFAAGYELPDGAEQLYTQLGWAVASPRELPTNPLIRTANPDIALMHAVRAFPFVDDTRVLIAGGSAGGYMTLMLAAETFPLAGAMPDVPPVNWGYNAAFFYKQKAEGKITAKLPTLSAVAGLLGGATAVYGNDYDDPIWYAHSPLAHVPTITCPVSVYWTTADMLVPMNQVGARWVQPFDKAQFPDGFTMEPEKLLEKREGRLTLVDVLPAADFEVFNLAMQRNSPARELPVSADKLWSITILDEGPPEPAVGHRKYQSALTRKAFLERVLTGKVPARQLTAPKLERLMDRYAGKEWLPSRLQHLDVAESERADVLRGLRTYVSSSAENAQTFADLYARLPKARQVLDADTVRELTRGAASR